MRRRTLGAIGVALLCATSAVAGLKKDQHVYIRARDTRAYPKPGSVGKPTLLQPSAKAYRWQANRAKDNEIKDESGKTYWVYGPNLSLTPPQQELVASKGSSSMKTDISAADAIKGLGEGAQWYAGEADDKAAGAQAKQSVATAEAIAYHVENSGKKAGAK